MLKEDCNRSVGKREIQKMSSAVSTRTSNLVGVCGVSITSEVPMHVMHFAKVGIYLQCQAEVHVHAVFLNVKC